MKLIETKAGLSLRGAVEQVYQVFRRYRPPGHLLDVCLNCCMDEKLEREMRQLPLRQLSARHFYEYNNSAKSALQPMDEVKYLLPRMLDLMAEGVMLHHSVELYLVRLGNCDLTAFSEREHAALDAFSLALFSDFLSGSLWRCDTCYAHCDALDVLLMFDIGGIDVQPLLDHWSADESLSATVSFAYSTYWDFWKSREVGNAFASERPGFREKMKNWLLAAQTRRAFADRLLALDTERLSDFACGSWMTPQDVVGAVFDAITD